MFKKMAFTNVYKEPIVEMEMNQIKLPEKTLYTLSKDGLAKLLQNNTGMVILKFGAVWCEPCKKIEGTVYEWFSKLPEEKTQCVLVDIDDDESFDLYATLKSKKMVNGVPTILAYTKDNLNIIPDLTVVGSDIQQVNYFFQQCLTYLNKV